jgi:hypothetical protein
MLALHLLQICMMYINTLMIQHVLAERSWAKRLTKEDFRTSTPRIYGYINLYGVFLLNMRVRLPIESAYRTAAWNITLRLVVEMLTLVASSRRGSPSRSLRGMGSLPKVHSGFLALQPNSPPVSISVNVGFTRRRLIVPVGVGFGTGIGINGFRTRPARCD